MATRYLTHIRSWWKDPFRNRATWAEKVTALLTAAIVVVGIFQLYVYRQMKGIMESSSQQTDKLIGAANIQAGAASKNAEAAASFSKSADSINRQTQIAVGDFQ